MPKTYRPLLTTTDNPYNPFTEFGAWMAFDTQHGYNTCELLGRVSYSSDVLDDGGDIAAMQQVVKYNVSGKHIMVTADTFDDLIQITDDHLTLLTLTVE